MSLVQPNQLREKIIIIGPAKVGKSTAHLSIAQAARDAGDDRKFWVLDTDDAMEVILTSEQYKGLNLELDTAYEWPSYEAFGEKVMSKAKRGDFIVIDMVDKAWTAVQNYFVKAAKKKSRAEALMDASSKGASGWDLFKQADIDWVTINAVYDEFLKPILYQSKAHVILVAEEKEVPDAPKGDKKDIHKHDRVTLGTHKPAGQKSLAYQARTVIRLNMLARGRVLTTLGDRERKWHDSKTYENFFQTYLCATGGWGVEEAAAKEATDGEG